MLGINFVLVLCKNLVFLKYCFQAHTRGLPADHEGPVRVVAIKGVDTNLCCGTHVSNTSQLQMIHLVGTEVKVNCQSSEINCKKSFIISK